MWLAGAPPSGYLPCNPPLAMGEGVASSELLMRDTWPWHLLKWPVVTGVAMPTHRHPRREVLLHYGRFSRRPGSWGTDYGAFTTRRKGPTAVPGGQYRRTWSCKTNKTKQKLPCAVHSSMARQGTQAANHNAAGPPVAPSPVPPAPPSSCRLATSARGLSPSAAVPCCIVDMWRSLTAACMRLAAAPSPVMCCSFGDEVKTEKKGSCGFDRD